MCWTLAGLRSLLAIRATLDVSREIEAEYLKTKELINKMGEQHQQELEDHGAEIISRMSSTFGVRNLLKTLDKTSEVNPLGTWIRQKREAKGLSQKELADMVGTSKSSVYRAESEGTSESLTAILNALTAETPAQEDHVQ